MADSNDTGARAPTQLSGVELAQEFQRLMDTLAPDARELITALIVAMARQNREVGDE